PDPSTLPETFEIVLPAPRSGPRLGGESRFSNSLRANIVFSRAQLKRSSPGGRTAARYVLVVNLTRNILKRLSFSSIRLNCSALFGVPVYRLVLCLKFLMILLRRSKRST